MAIFPTTSAPSVLRFAPLIGLSPVVALFDPATFTGSPAFAAAQITSLLALVLVCMLLLGQFVAIVGGGEVDTGRRAISALALALLLVVVHVAALVLVHLQNGGWHPWQFALRQLRASANIHGTHAALLLGLAIALAAGRGAFLSHFDRHLALALALFAAAGLATFHAIFRSAAGQPVLFSIALALPVVAAFALFPFVVWTSATIRRLADPLGQPAPVDGIDRNNRITFFLFGLITPVAASAASIILNVIGIWAVVSFVLRRFSFRLPPAARLPALAGIAYVAVFATATFVNWDSTNAFRQVAPVFTFLVFVVLVPRLVLTPGMTLIAIVGRASAFGLLAFAVAAAWEALFAKDWLSRAEVFSGNPTVAATAALILVAFCLSGLDRLPRQSARFRLLAAAAALAAAPLTGSIAAIFAMPFLLALVAWRYRLSLPAILRLRFRAGRRSIWLPALAAVIVVAGAGLIVVMPRLTNYLQAFFMSDGAPGDKLLVRLDMWRAAIAAIGDSWLFGHGVPKRFSAILPHLDPNVAGTILYTHVHNGFLTAGVAAGIPGIVATVALLLAPLAAVHRHARGPCRPDLLLLSAAPAAVYTASGLFGLVFFHDAMDAIFCMTGVLVVSAIGNPTADAR